MSKLLSMPAVDIPDMPAREKALDISTSWIVEAPAGSGKTGLLVQRFLRLLTDPNVSEPEQVLAITFTKAATEEIRDRVVRELTRASTDAETKSEYDRATRSIAKAVLLRDAARQWGLLDDPARLRVRTIDAVCAEIARSLPVLCNGNGSLTPVEDPEALYAEAARRAWMCLGGEDAALSDALRTLLLHRDGDLASCIMLVAEMLAHRQQWGSLIPAQEQNLQQEASDLRVLARLDHALEQIICDTLSRLANAFPERVLRRLTTLARTLAERSGYNGRPSPLAICRELESPPTAAADQLIYWRALSHLLISPSSESWRKRFNRNDVRFDLTDQDRSKLKELSFDIQQHPELLELLNDAVALPSSPFPSELWPLTKALFQVLRRALVELQTVFLETSQCDFVEPALLARYALTQGEGPDSLKTVLGTELQHMLVDEMQDTSGHQYDLIERLTDGWERTNKTVFLVGDPKQSIYLFRQARVERFNETMRRGMLGKLPVASLQLTANFRSQANLVEMFNQDFSRVFPQIAKRPEDVIYVQATSIRPVSTGPPVTAAGTWHLSVASGNPAEVQQTSREQTSHNAAAIREIIEAWRAHPLPKGRTDPWRIAILVQSRASLHPVLTELSKSPSIPVSAFKIDTLNERPEILDLLALTRALLHPADRTAWLAVLHAPWCGLALADLHTLTGKDDPTHLSRTIMRLVADHRTELSADGALRLKRVWPVLEAAVRFAGDLRLPERVERTWRLLRGDSYLDDTSLRNAATFFELLQAIDRERGEVVDTDLLRQLKRLYASPDSQTGAVDLVTIHGAKGLEWDVVVVPELERRSAVNSPRLFEWEELSSGGAILAPISGKGEEAIELTRWLRRVRSRRELAERKRLFYVACTRAREELHLFGVAAKSQSGSVTANPGSLLHASWNAAEPRASEMKDLRLSSRSHPYALSSVAAASDELEADIHRPTLERLPLQAMSVFRGKASEPDSSSTSKEESNGHLGIPMHGNLAARHLGTTIHLFLEEVAERLRMGTDVARLVSELPRWVVRMRAVLRGCGLPPRIIEQSAQTTLKALTITLQDPIGRWLLAAGVEARSELALTTNEHQITKHRMDRLFRAGPTPGALGSKYLWIIDYKTTALAGNRQDAAALQFFLDEERRRHQAQLETYARILNTKPVRLGLWFPLLGQLTWWGDDATTLDETEPPEGRQLSLFRQTQPL